MKRLAILLTALALALGVFSAQADLLPGEPSSTGDGMLARDQFMRLMKFIDSGYAQGMLYEDLAAFIGVEGKDRGNDGPNSMSALGDHNFQWFNADDSSMSVLVCFRGREETGRFEYCQWTAGNVHREDWKDVDLSDWLKAAAAGISTSPVSMVIQRFSFNPAVTVTAEMPAEGWEAELFGDDEIFFSQQIGESYNYPKISVKVVDDPALFDFYIDKYVNIQDIGTRDIAGVPFSGRTFTWESQQKDYTEYNLMLTEHVGIRIQADRIDLSDDMQGGRLLSSLRFSFTEADGTEYVFSADSGTQPAVTAVPAAQETQAPQAPEPMLAPEPTPAPEPTAAPAPEATEAPDEAEPVPNLTMNDDMDAYVGAWCGIYLHTAPLEGDPRTELGLEFTLILNADGSGSLDYAGSAEEGVWGLEEDGAVRFYGGGTPLSFQEDGTLLWGSYESGYIIFSRDMDATAAVFPQDPFAAAQPQALESPQGGDALGLAGRKFVAVTYIAGGMTLDASMLGGEYAILLREDGTADFTMAGMVTPGYTWRADGETIVVGAYGNDLMVITAEDENTILLEYSGTFTLKMVSGPEEN